MGRFSGQLHQVPNLHIIVNYLQYIILQFFLIFSLTINRNPLYQHSLGEETRETRENLLL